MRWDSYDILAVPGGAATGASTARACENLREKYVWISGTFVATLDVEASADGSSWVKVQTGINATGAAVSIPQSAKYVRVNLTAATSGQVVAKLTGFMRGES